MEVYLQKAANFLTWDFADMWFTDQITYVKFYFWFCLSIWCIKRGANLIVLAIVVFEIWRKAYRQSYNFKGIFFKLDGSDLPFEPIFWPEWTNLGPVNKAFLHRHIIRVSKNHMRKIYLSGAGGPILAPRLNVEKGWFRLIFA